MRVLTLLLRPWLLPRLLLLGRFPLKSQFLLLVPSEEGIIVEGGIIRENALVSTKLATP